MRLERVPIMNVFEALEGPYLEYEDIARLSGLSAWVRMSAQSLGHTNSIWGAPTFPTSGQNP